MPDLEPSITAWRKTLMAAPNVGRETLDELENHLRETVEQLVRSGVPETEAFQRAVAQLGPLEIGQLVELDTSRTPNPDGVIDDIRKALSLPG